MNRVTRDDTEHGVEYVRADEAQAEIIEQCRINGMSAEREWVGLTFAEICECENDYLHLFARAIEAKLKEKNT